jgi:hypothetical protein
MELAPVTEADARAQNAEIRPGHQRLRCGARPFVYAGSGDARLRARDCLAAAMIYEAGDDGKGQQAVGQVIINRARHPAFPKSICGVVFQGSERTTGCQFTFTCDGALNRRYSDAAWTRARNNADLMLSGGTYPTGRPRHPLSHRLGPPLLERQPRKDRDRRHASLLPLARILGHARRVPRRGVRERRAGRETRGDIAAARGSRSACRPSVATGVDANAAVGEARVVAPGAGDATGRDTIYTQLDRKAAARKLRHHRAAPLRRQALLQVHGLDQPDAQSPDSDAMSDTQRAAMTFSYLRDDKAGFEKALWNCSEYKRDDARQCMKR